MYRRNGIIPTYTSIAFKNEFDLLKGKPLSDIYSDIECVKLVYDYRTKKIFFLNSTKYIYHQTFCNEVLSDADDIKQYNIKNYGNLEERKYALPTLNYYKDQNIYTIEFVSEDAINTLQFNEMYEKLKDSFLIKEPIKLLVNSTFLEKIINSDSIKIPLVYPEDIFKNQKFQPIVVGTSYGFARKISDYKASISNKDIIFIEGTPLTLPICAGVVTNSFQTPLSHINILCNNRKIPSAVSVQYDSILTALHLWNEPIKFTVTTNAVSFIKCSEVELIDFYKNKKVNQKVILKSDNKSKKLVLFATGKALSINAIGSKAAGVARLYTIQKQNSTMFSVPENAFAIPFYYYAKHIQNENIKKEIEKLNKIFPENDIQNQLKIIRNAIKEAPIDIELLANVTQLILNYDSTISYRFRSSSNAEDLEGFNGAGLYESHTGIVNDSKKSIEKAIKKVWASVWTYNAFVERKLFNIDNNSVMMGILVERGFPHEQANGVAITKNIYRNDFPSFTVNVQKDEVSVVAPPDSVICDQFLSIGAENFTGKTGDVYVQYITKSNINNGVEVLTHQQIKQLHFALQRIKEAYYYSSNFNEKKYNFENFALDIEFKFNDGKLYIKQVRPFN